MNTETIKTGIIVLLIATTSFCLWKIAVGPGNQIGKDCPAYCNDSLRGVQNPIYGGGLPIGKNDAQILLDDFKIRINNLNDSARKYRFDTLSFPSGYWISKKAIDSLFMYNLTANGLYCNFAYDSHKDSVNLIFSVYRKDFVLIRKADQTIDQSMFISETLCPEECGSIASSE